MHTTTVNTTTLKIFAYDWRVRQVQNVKNYVTRNGEEREYTQYELQMSMFGVTDSGDMACVMMNNVKTSVTLEFPDSFDWSSTNFTRVKDTLRTALFCESDKADGNFTLVTKTPLYGANKPKQFLLIRFSSNVGKYAFIKRVNGTGDDRTGAAHRKHFAPLKFPCNVTGDQVKIHGVDVPVELQILEALNIPPCGWVQTDRACEVTPNSKRYAKQYRVHVSTFRAATDMGTTIPKLQTMAWDIEAKINDMKTPGAHPDDQIYMISVAVSDGTDYLLTLGPDGTEEDMCFDDKCIIRVYNCEQKLLLGFSELCRSLPVVARIGWNSFRFDCKVLTNRAGILNCPQTILDLGKMPPGEIVTGSGRPYDGKFDAHEPVHIDTHGVMCLDAMEMFKATYPKLPKFSLQYVAETFLGEGKDPITLSDLNKCHSELSLNTPAANEHRRLVGKYCVRDSRLTLNTVYRCDHLTSLFEMAAITRTPPAVVHHQKKQRLAYNLMHSECVKNNVAFQDNINNNRAGALYKYRMSSSDTEDANGGDAEAAATSYTGAYVRDPTPGLYKNVGSLDVNSMYPTLMIAYNLCYTTVVDHDKSTEFNDEEDFEFVQWEDHVGCEHDPIVVEYKRLSELYSKSSKQSPEEEKRESGVYSIFFPRTRASKRKIDIDGECSTVHNSSLSVNEQKDRIRLDTLSRRIASIGGAHRMCREQRYKILKRQVRPGILPCLVDKLLLARKNVRAQMKNVVSGDDGVLSLLNQRQLAYKITANSVYGTTGVSNGLLPCQNVAKVTTAQGRKTILQSIDIVEGRGLDVIYSDTDSVYIQLGEGVENPWEFLRVLADDITSQLRRPMRIESEDEIYERVLFVAKKSYICRKLNKDGSVCRKLDYHGGIAVRRDYSNFVKGVFSKAVETIFKDYTIESIMESMATSPRSSCLQVKKQYYASIDRVKCVVFDACLALMRLTINTRDLTQTSEIKSIGDGVTLRQCCKKNAAGRLVTSWKLGNYTVKIHPDHHAIICGESICDADYLRGHYKSQLPAPVQLYYKMIDRCRPLVEGGRIEYLMVRKFSSNNTKSSASDIEEINYYNDNCHRIKINKQHYINQLIKPVNKVMECVWKRSDIIYDAVKPFLVYSKVVEEYKLRYTRPILLCSNDK